MLKKWALILGIFLLATLVLGDRFLLAAPPPQNPQNGSVGLQGEIPASAPTQAATITVPGNGQSFSAIPITVAGICPKGLLVEIFKNNVFSGSAQCSNGSFSLPTDLFDGSNDLIARVYDNLNQSGPDSNTVTVNFNSLKPSPGPRISLTSQFSKRGALPGATLSWPIALSGGVSPYALSIDWGDQSAPNLISQSSPGNINLEHAYQLSGIYNVTIKATDSNGQAAFLQVVGVGNGPVQQNGTSSSNKSGSSNSSSSSGQTTVVWWPLVVMLVLMAVTFVLGKRQEVEQIRTRIRKGQKPF